MTHLGGTFDQLLGRLAAERYTIDGLIGTGDFGAVYSARDVVLGRDVAIKVVPLSPSRSGTSEELLAEARAAAAAGRSAVTVHDVLIHTDGIGIVMELIRGGNLAASVQYRASPAQGLRYATSAAVGLAEVHEAGVLHLDLHPGNLLVRDDDTIAIGDFGLAQLARSSGLSRGAHEILWSAPELLQYGVASAQADIYALGLILGWLSRRTGLESTGIVDRSTQADPRNRYSSTHEMVDDLSKLKLGVELA